MNPLLTPEEIREIARISHALDHSVSRHPETANNQIVKDFAWCLAILARIAETKN